MKNRICFLGMMVLFFISTTTRAQEVDNGQEIENEYSWPIELETEKGLTITLYQPQLESFSGNILEGRMAVTIKPKDNDMIFGAVWYQATVSTDTENRTVILQKMHILKTHFPEMVDEAAAGKKCN